MLKFEKRVEEFSAQICFSCSRLSLLTYEPRDKLNFKCLKCKPKRKRNVNVYDNSIITDLNSSVESEPNPSYKRSSSINEITVPDSLPNFLKENMLTFIEEQLIALVFVQQFIYLRGFSEVASKGHCINFNQDISPIAEVLPHLPSDLPIVIIKKKGSHAISQDIRVRREVVLLWLKMT